MKGAFMNFKNFKYHDELATDVEAGLYALCKQIDLRHGVLSFLQI